MGKPIAPAQGSAFAFPDVCLTPAGPSSVPIPYPNIADLGQATGVTDIGGKEVLAGPAGLHVLLRDSQVATSTGDQPGTGGGVVSLQPPGGACRVVQASATVVYGPNRLGIARFMDATKQNNNNADGCLLASLPTVLVGD